MRIILTLAAITALAAPALAQAPPRHPAKHARAPHMRAYPTSSPGTPLDRGPFTPEANRAYQGGGVILQGAPGAPAPMPAPTPPGQAPANSVPVR
ncbi:MAG: hypothetical protein ACRYGM_29175 [Janthinobacterium lividum]